jgi:cytochrome c oxidase subunit I+III
VTAAATREELAVLDKTWRSPPGFFAWFTHVNHRSIGRRFIVTAFIFFLLGGIQALLMRVQLATPENGFLDPDLYRQLLTMHGTTMMFFFAVPIMEGFAIYLVPLMIGTRDMAFPRLNAFGYYVYAIAGITLYVSLFLNMAPDAGWFAYVPLSSPQHSPGLRMDVWATMITFIEVSALVAAVELIVTILKQRAPGMSLNRMPLFVWAILVTSFMIVFAMPPVMVASVMLALDRSAETHFFNVSHGGDAVLWQHLFWFFGHPEVYIIFVPALGFVSSIIATSTRRAVFGYTAIVLALVGTGVVAFGLWVHHMFTTGLPQLGMSFFTAASITVAIPSGVQIFCWIATLWGNRPQMTTAMLFVLGFFFIFVLGGLTGVMVASVPFDMQAHDTFFVVAHFHYVLIGGAVFPLFGALHYWFPKLTGRMLHDGAGKLTFGLMFVGFNVAFFPMHVLGLQGMPRRVYTYSAELGVAGGNLLATVGAFTLGLGVALFLGNALRALRMPVAARAADPWGADTLEWSVPSPPPNYNFGEIPVVRGRWARWAQRHEPETHVVGLAVDKREVLVTRVLDAEPQTVALLPGPSPWPFALAVAASVAFIGLIFSLWAFPIGFLLAFVALVGWHWPREGSGSRREAKAPGNEEKRAAEGTFTLSEEPAE